MADVFQRLLEHWHHHHVAPAATKASADDIVSWEKKYGVRLPDDLREYVTRINGVFRGEELEFDNNLNTLLPLSAIRPENEGYNSSASPNHFVIADHCISCFWWTVELDAEPHTTIAVFLSGTIDGRPQVVATSLSEFLEMYVADAPAMYGSTRKS